MSAAAERQPPRWSGVLAWAVWALTMLGLAVAAWLDDLQRQAGSPETAWLPRPQRSLAGGGGERGHGRGAGWQPPPGAPGGLAAARPGAAGGGQRRRLRVRQLWAGGPARERSQAPATWPGSPTASRSWLACVSFVLLLTPTGSLPSRALALVGRGGGRHRVLVLLAAVDPQPLLPEHRVEPLAVGPDRILLAIAAIAALIVLASLVAAAWSLVVRFRRARETERQQLRWLALGASVEAVALLVEVVAGRWPG